MLGIDQSNYTALEFGCVAVPKFYIDGIYTEFLKKSFSLIAFQLTILLLTIWQIMLQKTNQL